MGALPGGTNPAADRYTPPPQRNDMFSRAQRILDEPDLLKQRRMLVAASGGYEATADTPTDIAVRDLESGRVRRARAGSTRSALYDPNAPASSVLGSV